MRDLQRFRFGIKPSKPLIKVRGNELPNMEFKFFEFKYDDVVYIVTLKVDKVKKTLKEIEFNLSSNNYLWLELNNHLNGQINFYMQ